MPPRPTQNSNREDDLIEEVESGSQTTSTGLLGTPVGPVPPEVTPGTPYDTLPDLAKAFGQLASHDSAKVTYVLSFLHGTVLDWFEPTLTSGHYAPWLTDYCY